MKLIQAEKLAEDFIAELSEKLYDYDIPVKTSLETPIINIDVEGHIKPFQIGSLRTIKESASMKIIFIEEKFGYSLIFKVKGITFKIDITLNLEFMFDFFMKKLIYLRLVV